ncbi:MAG: GAF and HD-GYP domain-containing protein, partial [Planctomycetota bacterium]
QQIEKFSNELSRAYEEIVLLYNLSTNMQMTQSSASYLQMACDQLTQLIQVEGIAVFIEREVDDHKQLILSAGSGVMVVDTVQADILQMYLVEQLRSGKDALIDSTQDGPLKYQWPETVRNIIAVPLGSADNLLGCLVATNALDKPDFDTTDIKLFNSVANQCTVFIENNRLFDELKELFVGCLKALTNSIDAKDQYTRGHSERVAFIARWIAEHLGRIRPVSDKLVHHAYLAGLLHDIGKIGIGESVLRKNGRLSDTEYAAIQSHPRIGASILSGIHQMEDIVPGVLGHHERVDGRGYPHGLKGDEIPLIAKIVSLADAFDAMTSKRVYRNAMNIQKALDIIADAIGTQFDEEVARVFLDSDVQKLWKIIQDGFIENWNFSNIDEYGVQAVGELI